MTTNDDDLADDRPADDEDRSADAWSEVRRKLAETVAALADEVQATEIGWVARTPLLPLVHTLNQVHVDSPASTDRVLELSHAYQSELGYRHVVVDDAGTARRLEQVLIPKGWTCERLVDMVLLALPDREVETTEVTELGEEEALALMRSWGIEDRLDVDEDTVNQLAEYNRREGRLWGERRLGVRDTSGRAVSLAKLRSSGPVSWVEDVYTLPEHRNNGHARALVTEAVSRALAEASSLIFIVANDDDWPKYLYGEIGFRPVGRSWTFHQG